MNQDFTPFLSGFSSYFEIFAGLCIAFALWEPFRIGFEKVISTENDKTEVKEMLLRLVVVKEEIENELAKSPSNTTNTNNGILSEISNASVEQARQGLNDAITKIGEVKNAYNTLGEAIKNRGKITETSFLLTAIYCFSFIILIGIEAHYQWNILKIERMIYFYSVFTLICILFSLLFPNNAMSKVNGTSIVGFPILYLGCAILILISYECLDFIKFSNHQVNACMNIGIILIMPLVPFALHIWATPYILDKQKNKVDMEYENILSFLPEVIKKRIEKNEQPPI